MTSDDLQPPTQFSNGDQGDYVITTDIGNRRNDQKESVLFLVKVKQASWLTYVVTQRVKIRISHFLKYFQHKLNIVLLWVMVADS